MKSKKVILVLALFAAGIFVLRGCGDDDSGATDEFSCTDSRDNDGDGLTDCDDPDCTGNPTCTSAGETNCTDGVDDDNDGFTDCGDTDCSNDPSCTTGTETNCSNGVDDDNDTYTDCSDSDCTDDPACPSGTETNCSNGIDDDNDTYTDCNDADCTNDPACSAGSETNCTNQIDDDSDGATDCVDADCANDPACQTGNGEIGDPCTTASQCNPPAGLTAECVTNLFTMITFPNGYCSATCDTANDQCGPGAVCGGMQMVGAYCFKTCTDASECQSGYNCEDPMLLQIGQTVCFPPMGFPSP